MSDPKRLRRFVQDFTRLIEQGDADEQHIFSAGEPLLAELVRNDDWLPEQFAQASAESYRQYLLYCDPLERFSVVSFVWGPGQSTPVHDHLVWGMIGMMRGEERCAEYSMQAPGKPLVEGACHRILPGEVDRVSPTVGDIHKVSNALADRASVSIHVYGGNIAAISRHVFDSVTGVVTPFVSGYSNTVMPNLWDRSSEVRARVAS